MSSDDGSLSVDGNHATFRDVNQGTAIDLYEKALALSKTAFGPEHLMTSDIMAYIGFP